jgi:cysteine desulfuration protein SufE
MKIPAHYLTNPIHRELVDELLSLSTAEERLEWLMERPRLHRALETSERTDACKVPGCLSGLWLKGEVKNGRCYFAAHSDSDLVNGVVSFICDLYSDRSPSEVLEIGAPLTRALGLDGLLSTTRQRAVSSSLAFFHHTASQYVGAA